MGYCISTVKRIFPSLKMDKEQSTDGFGVPTVKPYSEKTEITRIKKPLFRFWKHEFIVSGNEIVRTTEVGTIPTKQEYVCRICEKKKYVSISY